jgi:hypothetical protein
VYGIVVASALWGVRSDLKTALVIRGAGNHEPELAPTGLATVQVSRPLCVAALVWILFLLAVINLQRSAWINCIVAAIALAVGASWYFWGRPHKSAG